MSLIPDLLPFKSLSKQMKWVAWLRRQLKQWCGEMARLQETAIRCWAAKVITINENCLGPAKWIGLPGLLSSLEDSDKRPHRLKKCYSSPMHCDNIKLRWTFDNKTNMPQPKFGLGSYATCTVCVLAAKFIHRSDKLKLHNKITHSFGMLWWKASQHDFCVVHRLCFTWFLQVFMPLFKFPLISMGHVEKETLSSVC